MKPKLKAIALDKMRYQHTSSGRERHLDDAGAGVLARKTRGQMDRVISGHVQCQGAESPDGIFSPHKLDTTRN
jgi:hypothetical protein